jgi:hypothetical protein
MPLTLLDIKEKLKLLDEITILETLNISTEDLLERFIDRIEENADTLEGDLEEDDDDERE